MKFRWMAQLQATALMALCLTALLGCAQKPAATPVSAAIEGAQRLERRASAAYAKGDLLGASKDYQTAAAVYASLALAEPLATVELNLAKLEGESGRAARGLALVEGVLRKTQLPAATRLMAHGRAAALSLGTQKLPNAQQHLDAADALCLSRCEAASALAALRADYALQSGDAAAAIAHSTRAVQLAKTPSDTANALRSRAAASLSGANINTTSNAPTAIADAEQALVIDQTLGAASRVIADLALLEAAHRKVGNALKADEYQAMLAAAQAAREQLRLP
jgi:hypothetical protein